MGSRDESFGVHRGRAVTAHNEARPGGLGRNLEDTKLWAGTCAELANRGIHEVLIVCCGGLVDLPEAIEATWSQATVQTCTVH